MTDCPHQLDPATCLPCKIERLEREIEQLRADVARLKTLCDRLIAEKAGVTTSR